MLRSLVFLALVFLIAANASGVSAQVLLWYMGDVAPDTIDSCGPGYRWVRYTGVDQGELVDDIDAWDGKAWHINDVVGAKDHWRTGPSENIGSGTGATIVARVKVISEQAGGGNIGIMEGAGISAEYHWGGPTGHVKETQRGDEIWLPSPIADSNYHILRLTAKGTMQSDRVIRLYLDENPVPVLEITNALHVGSDMDAFMFGSTSTAGSQDVYFDWITATNLGAFYPGEEVLIYGRSLVPERETGITIDQCKKLSNGAQAELANVVVTACIFTCDDEGNTTPSGFIIEKPDRSAGIRVSYGSTMILPGENVDISGTITTVDGERIIAAKSVIQNSSGNPVPAPVCLSNRSSGGGVFEKQEAVVDDASQIPPKMSQGANNVGILVKLTGKVTAVNEDPSRLWDSYVYIDDGSGLNDGSGNIGIRCSPATDLSQAGSMPPLDSYVTMTGGMGVKRINGVNARYFWCSNWQVIPQQ